MVLARLEKVSAAPSPFGEVLGVDLLYGNCSLNCGFFSVTQAFKGCHGLGAQVLLRWEANYGTWTLLPSSFSRWRGDHKQWCLPVLPALRAFQPLPFGWFHYILVVLLNLDFFLCPSTGESAHGPLVLSLPTVVHSVGVGVSLCYCVPLLCCLFVVSIFCCAEAVQLALSSSSGGIALQRGVICCVPRRK